MQTQDAKPATLGGYRLVRSLDAGSRADVALGAGKTGSVVLKVFRPEVPDEDVGRELEALGRVPTAHCARLIDVVATSARHPVLAFERVHRGSMAQWLRDRGEIAPGEAVTLLAPLATTLTRLHRAGVAHTNLVPANIHLGIAGEPVILGFGHASLFEAESSIAVIDASPEARADRIALAGLARLVLAAVRTANGAIGAERFDDWLRAASFAPGFEFAAELEARLFEFASPTALEFSRSGRAAPPERPLGEEPLRRFDPVVGEPAAAVRQSFISPAVTTSAPGRLLALLDTSPIHLVRRMALPAIRSVRRPVWVVAGAVTVALVAALVLVPQGGGAQQARAEAPLRQDAAEPHATSTPQARRASHASRSADPLVALPALLLTRAGCFTARSVRCLSGVDDDASGALIADSAAIKHMQLGGQSTRGTAVAAPAPRLVERLGDSALVRLDARGSRANAKPASVLLIRTKAGWRIRSYLSGKQAQSG